MSLLYIYEYGTRLRQASSRSQSCLIEINSNIFRQMSPLCIPGCSSQSCLIRIFSARCLCCTYLIATSIKTLTELLDPLHRLANVLHHNPDLEENIIRIKMNTNIIYLKWSAMNAGGSINKSDDRENGLKVKKATCSRKWFA